MSATTHTFTRADLTAWQAHLDFLLPRTATIRVDQLAAAVGVDERTVARAFEGPARDGQGRLVRPWLLGFAINAAGGQRFHRRIPRDCALLWLAHSANYTPEEFLAAVSEVLANRHPRELVLLQQRISELLRTKS